MVLHERSSQGIKMAGRHQGKQNASASKPPFAQRRQSSGGFVVYSQLDESEGDDQEMRVNRCDVLCGGSDHLRVRFSVRPVCAPHAPGSLGSGNHVLWGANLYWTTLLFRGS